MALTVTPGYEHESGGIVTPTRLNTAISGLTVNMAAGKRLATTTAGAATEVTDPILCRVSTQFDKVDTTLADVTGLSVTLEAGKTYTFNATLFVTEDTTGRSKLALSGTATATSLVYNIWSPNTSNTGNASAWNSTRKTVLDSAVSNTSAGAIGDWMLDGTITVNTGGTLTIQFAQNSASGTSSVLVGSYFHVTPYA